MRTCVNKIKVKCGLLDRALELCLKNSGEVAVVELWVQG
jgi:hypothetical protein